jgi:hypothetical protein
MGLHLLMHREVGELFTDRLDANAAPRSRTTWPHRV